MNKNKKQHWFTALALAVTIPLVGQADPPSDVDILLEMLREKGMFSEQDEQVFRDRVSQVRKEAAPEPRYPGLDYEPTAPLLDASARVQARPFRVESSDGKNRFGIRGRLMLDTAFADWDDNLNTASNHDNLARRGTIIRRARLGALGVYDNTWEWQMEVDFRDSEVRFANAYIAYLADSGRFAIGHFWWRWYRT